MSVRKPLPAVWRDAVRDSDLDTTAKAVAWCLSTYFNAHGIAWPSVSLLATGASIGRRAAGLALKRLEAEGFLDVEWSRGKSSHRFAASLPSTASQGRSSEWATASLATSNRVFGDTNRVARTQEDAESVESGALSRGRLAGAAPRANDDCIGCGERKPLVDDDHCAECAERRAA